MLATLLSFWKSIITLLIISWLWVRTESIPIIVAGLTSDIFAWFYDKIYGIPPSFKPQYLWRGNNPYEQFVQARERTAWFSALFVKTAIFGMLSYAIVRILRFGEGVWHNYKKTDPQSEENPRRASSPPRRRVEPQALVPPGLPPDAAGFDNINVVPYEGDASLSRNPSVGQLQQLGSFSQRGSEIDLQQWQGDNSFRPPSRGAEEEAQLQAALAGTPFDEGSDLRGSFMGGASYAALAAVASRRAGSAPIRERPRSGSSSSNLSALPQVPVPEEEVSAYIPSRDSADAAPERVTGIDARVEVPHLRQRPGHGSGIAQFSFNASRSLEGSPSYTPAAAAASPLVPSLPEVSPSYTPAATSGVGLPSFEEGNIPRDLQLLQQYCLRSWAGKKP